MGPTRAIDDTTQVRLSEAGNAYFGPQLARAGLSEEQIDRQTLPEFEESLERINETIAHPESFGSLNISATAKSLFIATACARA
jgi:hypothetical protein